MRALHLKAHGSLELPVPWVHTTLDGYEGLRPQSASAAGSGSAS
jgi:hypothetical protein